MPHVAADAHEARRAKRKTKRSDYESERKCEFPTPNLYAFTASRTKTEDILSLLPGVATAFRDPDGPVASIRILHIL